MKKKRKIIIPTVLVAAVLVITAVVLYHNPLPGMGGWFPQEQTASVVEAVSSEGINSVSEVEAPSYTDVLEEQASIPESINSFALDPNKTYQFDQPFVTKDLKGSYTITVHSAQMSKDLQGCSKEDYYYTKNNDKHPERNEITDETGHFTSPHSYLFTELSIENMQEQEITVCVGNIRLLLIDPNGLQIERDVNPEVHYIDKNSELIDSEDFYYLTIKPNEKVDLVLGYTVYEPELYDGARLFLQFNLMGEGTSDGEGTAYYYPAVDLKLPE